MWFGKSSVFVWYSVVVYECKILRDFFFLTFCFYSLIYLIFSSILYAIVILILFFHCSLFHSFTRKIKLEQNIFNNYTHLNGKLWYIHKDYTALFWISAQGDWDILGDFKLFKLNNNNKTKLFKNYAYVKYGIIMPSIKLHMLKTKAR